MKIDKDFHISFNFENSEGSQCSFYIDFIDKHRLQVASTFLGEIYSLISENRVNPDVFVIDWPILLKSHIEKIDEFISHIFNTSLMNADGFLIEMAKPLPGLLKELEKHHIDEDILIQIKGLILFICALCRYSTKQTLKNVEGLFYTYKTASEWKNSQELHLSSPAEASQESQTKEQLDL